MGVNKFMDINLNLSNEAFRQRLLYESQTGRKHMDLMKMDMKDLRLKNVRYLEIEERDIIVGRASNENNGSQRF